MSILNMTFSASLMIMIIETMRRFMKDRVLRKVFYGLGRSVLTQRVTEGMVNSAAALRGRVGLAAALSASAYLIQSMFSFSSCTTAPYFWITCAILIAIRSSMCAPGAR